MKNLYLKLKSSKNFIAGIFSSLGISILANKIDFLIYWETTKLKELWLSIFFGIISIVIGIWFFEDNKE